jgi:membrane-bound inhibitor of C-type lysozyme
VSATGLRMAAAIAALASTTIARPAEAQIYRHYECEGGAQFDLTLLPDDKAVFVQLDGKSLRLPKFVSVIGTRYRGNGVTVWIKSDRATLRRVGKRIECKLK